LESTINKITNVLAMITLIQLMVTIGLGVAVREVWVVAADRALLFRAAAANYVLVPAVVVGLLLLFRAPPMVAVGFLIPAVCPGAPYGPPLTAIARGNVAMAVGLMVLLAGSSAILAPLVLGFLLPLMATGEPLRIDVGKLVATLAVTQILPLCVGLYVFHRKPVIAGRLKRPMARVSTLLNLTLLGVIIGFQFRMLAEIRLVGYIGMLTLLAATALAGWSLGGPGSANRKSMTLSTSIRNVGLSLVIVTGSFAGTAAVTATTAYGLLQTVLMALVALAWGRWTPTSAPGCIEGVAQ